MAIKIKNIFLEGSLQKTAGSAVYLATYDNLYWSSWMDPCPHVTYSA